MSTAVVDIADLVTRIADIRRIFHWCDTLPHGKTVDLNHTENNLSSVNRAFFRLARENENGSWSSLQSVHLHDIRLLSLATDLRTANEAHTAILQRMDRGGLIRSGRRPRISSRRTINDEAEVLRKLRNFVVMFRDGSVSAGEAAGTGWGDAVPSEDGFGSPADGSWGADGWGAQVGDLPDSGWGASVTRTPADSGWGAPISESVRHADWGEPCDGCGTVGCHRWEGGWDCPSAGLTETSHNTAVGSPRSGPREHGAPVVAGGQGGQTMQETTTQRSDQPLASRLAGAAVEAEQPDAGWQEAIRELKEVVGQQRRGMAALKTEMSAAVAAEAAKREVEVHTLRQQLQAEQEGRKSLEQEVKSLKEELSALRVSVASVLSAPAIPDWTTEVGLDILILRILSSSRFTETISRLLSLTVDHTLSLSVGCFAIIVPDRIVQIAGACGIQHSLAALGALHELPAWAGERDGLFKGLVEGALANDSTVSAVKPNSKLLDEEMLAMLKAGDIGDPTPGDARMEEVSAAFAEEKEAIRLAWADLVQAIKAQCQAALSEITQHRTAATEIISAAGAEAVRAVCEQSELELLGLEGKADKLDQAMLDFQRLYPAPTSSSSPIPTATTSASTTPPLPDSVKILALLEQLVAAQSAARSPAPPQTWTVPQSLSFPPTPLPSHLKTSLPPPPETTPLLLPVALSTPWAHHDRMMLRGCVTRQGDASAGRLGGD